MQKIAKQRMETELTEREKYIAHCLASLMQMETSWKVFHNPCYGHMITKVLLDSCVD